MLRLHFNVSVVFIQFLIVSDESSKDSHIRRDAFLLFFFKKNFKVWLLSNLIFGGLISF